MSALPKGQWFLDIDKNDGSGKWDYNIRESSGSEFIGDAQIAKLNPYLRTKEANAAIIVAAADLLEALEMFMEQYDGEGVERATRPEIVKARAAIKKAKGEVL